MKELIKKIDLPIILAGIAIICVFLFWDKAFNLKNTKIIDRTEIVKQEKQITKNNNIDKETYSAIEKKHNNISILNQTKIQNNKLNDIKLTNQNSDIEVLIDPTNACIKETKIKNMLDVQENKNIILDKDYKIGKPLYINEKDNTWQLTKIHNPIILTDNKVLLKRDITRQDKSSFTITQIFELLDHNTIQYDINIHNTSKKPINISNLYIWLGNMLPLEHITKDSSRYNIQSVDIYKSNNTMETYKSDNDKKFENNIKIDKSNIRFIANYNKYITNILKQSNSNNKHLDGSVSVRYDGYDENGQSFKIINSAGNIKNISINPNEINSIQLKYYAGPKSIQLMNKFDKYASQIVHLAFFTMETLAKFLLYALIKINSFVHNYGLAIIILTILLRLMLWPISYRANRSMKIMSALNPLIAEIKEKYANDKTMMNSKIMEVYRNHKINPLSTVLPLILQIPIFITLYWTLDGAIELRQASFLWITDLTQTDKLFNLFDSVPLNILPILMGLTMFIQQRMSPTIDKSQSTMMFAIIPILLIICYWMSSGLMLYWVTSQTVSIIQLYFDRKNINKYNDIKENNTKYKRKHI